MQSTARPRARLLPSFAVLVLALTTSCSHSLPTALAPERDASGVTSGGTGGGSGRGGSHKLEDEVVVVLVAGADPAAVAATHHATLLEYEADERSASYLPGTSQTPDELLAALSADARVLTAEANFWLENAEARQQSFAFDDGSGTPDAYAEQPAAAAIHLGQAHEIAAGAGVIVAILDSGIDPRHPLLRHTYAGGIDLVDGDDDPTDSRDFLDNDGDGQVDETYGHGTHVAGIIHLVAPEARLLAVRVLDADGRGSLFDVANGVIWAMDHGAKVINLSLGSLKSSDALQNALSEAECRGIIVISSAGNWGASTPVEFPARSSHVAAIAAVDSSATPATFSSYGNNIALSAPGVGVRSTYPGGTYRLWSGTSMAAPFVAGACALLAEHHPDWSLVEAMTRLGETAHPVAGTEGQFGAGALDAGAALERDRNLISPVTGIQETVRPR